MPKISQLTGQTFGMLTVEERTDQKEDRYYLWKCRCVCGNTILVSTKKLTRGTIISCGCTEKRKRPRGAPAEDIARQRYGKLVAVERVPSYKGRTRWRCKCDCGNEKIVTKEALKAGKVKSCGCLRAISPGHLYKDLTGQMFGRLTVLEPTERRDSKGSVFWRCRCDCGEETEVSADSLTSGNTVSCGCRKQEMLGSIQQSLTFVDNTCIDYLRSRKSRSDNKSGHRGVYRIGDKYRVNIGFQNKRYYLGTYRDFEEAVNVRQEAERELHETFLKLYDWWHERAEEDPAWAEENPLTFHVEVKDREVYITSPLLKEANLLTNRL